MKKEEEFRIQYVRYSDREELDGESNRLIDKAISALDSSYSPYSHFQVGAAILLENGEIITGSNQENGAYPSGLCAERVALYYAGARYPGVPIVSMAVVARYNGALTAEPISPCGACRQAMQEYRTLHAKPFSLLMVGERSVVEVVDVEQMLPFSFSNVNEVTRKE